MLCRAITLKLGGFSRIMLRTTELLCPAPGLVTSRFPAARTGLLEGLLGPMPAATAGRDSRSAASAPITVAPIWLRPESLEVPFPVLLLLLLLFWLSLSSLSADRPSKAPIRPVLG